MDQIFPIIRANIDPSELLTQDTMDRRDDGRDRPWIMANMIMSSDGAYARAGRSGGLGGPADREMFHTLRGLTDAILVGAGTARQERYRRPNPDGETTQARIRRGQAPAPLLALVSRSGHVPADQPFREGAGPDPIVFLPGTNMPDHDDEDDAVGVDYRSAGVESVDLSDVIGQLGGEGARIVLCEGGPRLLGDLADADLLDQMFITIAPQLVGGSHTGLLGERPELQAALELNSVVHDDGYLMLNYTVVH